MYTHPQDIVSEHLIPYGNIGLRSIYAPLQELCVNTNLLIDKLSGLTIYDIQRKNSTEFSFSGGIKPIKLLSLTNDVFLSLSTQGSDLQLNLHRISTQQLLQTHVVTQIQKHQLNGLRFQAKEQAAKRGDGTGVFDLFILQKYEPPQEMVNAQTVQNIFILHQYVAEIGEENNSIQFIKKVELSATLRTFELVPLWSDGCMLYGPQHFTAKPFQFIVWDSKEIQVHQTTVALKGTVVGVLPVYQSGKLSISPPEICVFYNTNGGNSPNIMRYNIDTKQETHQPLLNQQDTPQMLVQVLPQIVNHTYCYLVMSDLINNFLVIFDLSVNQILCKHEGGCGSIQILGKHRFCTILSHFDEPSLKLRLYNQHPPLLLSLHYLIKCQQLLSIDQSLIEEVFSLIESGQQLPEESLQSEQ